MFTGTLAACQPIARFCLCSNVPRTSHHADMPNPCVHAHRCTWTTAPLIATSRIRVAELFTLTAAGWSSRIRGLTATLLAMAFPTTTGQYQPLRLALLAISGHVCHVCRHMLRRIHAISQVGQRRCADGYHGLEQHVHRLQQLHEQPGFRWVTQVRCFS